MKVVYLAKSYPVSDLSDIAPSSNNNNVKKTVIVSKSDIHLI